MTTQIRVLPDTIINKIAAGEVIENPSSVVKELVENALDAKATEITIEIAVGGRQLIRICDNGVGMSQDDALLSLERHATSKIRSAEDLEGIATMGFRGEAVPSIASISKMTLITSKDSKPDTGAMIIVEGGKVVKCCPAARSQGTTFEIKSLFFNVPVRRKFQRSPTYDQTEVLKVVSAIALANPSVKFQLIANQKPLLSCPGQDNGSFCERLKTRIQHVLGSEFSKSLKEVHYEQGEFSLKGFISDPLSTRPTRSAQHLFIHKRPIVSKFISTIIKEGYGHALPENRHPLFVLHFDLPGQMVDVNVHPRKREVRFRMESKIRDFLLKAVMSALQVSAAASSLPLPEIDSSALLASLDSEPPVVPTIQPCTPQPTTHPFEESSSPIQQSIIAPPKPAVVSSEPSLMKQVHPAIIATVPGYILVETHSLPLSEQLERENLKFLLIDQRRAHSRVLYEKIRQQSRHQPLESQELLIPIRVELSAVEAALLEEHLTSLHEVGFRIEQARQHIFMVNALPSFFKPQDVESLLTSLIENLSTLTKAKGISTEKDKSIAIASSRAALGRSHHLGHLEAMRLIQDLFSCQNPYCCPAGHPTISGISVDEIERKFQR